MTSAINHGQFSLARPAINVAALANIVCEKYDSKSAFSGDPIVL